VFSKRVQVHVVFHEHRDSKAVLEAALEGEVTPAQGWSRDHGPFLRNDDAGDADDNRAWRRFGRRRRAHDVLNDLHEAREPAFPAF